MEAQTFSPFTRLPTELRIKIFLSAISEPSIIPLYSTRLGHPGTDDESWGQCRHQSHAFIFTRPVPSLFHVCAESRAICLAHYTLGFAVSITKSRTLEIRPYSANGHHDHVLTIQHTRPRCRHEEIISSEPLKHIYWNPNVDVIHMKGIPDADHGACEADYDLSKTAYIWSDYHWSRFNLLLTGIQRLALNLMMFRRWYQNPRRRMVRGVEVVYVLLKRQLGESNQEWEEHLQWFGRWFARRQKAFFEDKRVQADLLPYDRFQLKLVGLVVDEELDVRHLANAVDWVEDTTGNWRSEDHDFQTQRYPEIWR